MKSVLALSPVVDTRYVLGEALPAEAPSFVVDPAVERRIRVRSQVYAFLCQFGRQAELPTELREEQHAQTPVMAATPVTLAASENNDD